MGLVDHSVQELLDRLSWRTAASVIVLVTLAFASAYYALTILAPYHGLQETGVTRIPFVNCIYFSIVTETTLGDGSMSPHGFARAVVSIQVLLGLIIAGLLVAKITSAPSATAARLASMTEGDWGDCLCCQETGIKIVGRSWIEATGSGLRFQGTDFYHDGTRSGAFISHSLSLTSKKVIFSLQSYDVSKELFTGGTSTLTFSDVDDRGRFTQYSISLIDSSGATYKGIGRRLNQDPEILKATREQCPEEMLQEFASFMMI